MSIDVDKQAQLASWVHDVKFSVKALNEILAKSPEGIDVKVSTGETILVKEGEIVGFHDGKTVWQVNVTATKTETLI